MVVVTKSASAPHHPGGEAVYLAVLRLSGGGGWRRRVWRAGVLSVAVITMGRSSKSAAGVLYGMTNEVVLWRIWLLL